MVLHISLVVLCLQDARSLEAKLSEFRGLREPGRFALSRGLVLRGAYSSLLGERVPDTAEDAHYYATYPLYRLALEIMNSILCSASDYINAVDARKDLLGLAYMKHLRKLDLLSEHITDLDRQYTVAALPRKASENLWSTLIVLLLCVVSAVVVIVRVLARKRARPT